MIVCPQCHQANAETNKFCLYCGTSLVPSSQTSQFSTAPPANDSGGDVPSPQTLPDKQTAQLAWTDNTDISDITWSPHPSTSAPETTPPDLELPGNLAPLISRSSETPSPESEIDTDIGDHEFVGDDELTVIPNAIETEPETDATINLSGISLLPNETTWVVVVYPCESDSRWLNCPDPEAMQKILEQETQRPNRESYLDDKRRYRCLTSFNFDTRLGQVEDTKPDAPTHVQAMSQTLIQNGELFDLTRPEEMLAQLQADPHAPFPVVLSYLSLRLLLSEFIPRIHDAWVGYGTGQVGIDEPRQFVLIQNRSPLPSLAQAWQDPQYGNEQLLAWMEEMTELWPQLLAWGCAASLLDETNLCVCGEGVLAVRHLDFTPIPDEHPRPLITLWQSLLNQAPPSRQQAFQPLQVMLQTQSLETVADLQALVEQLWETLQSDLINLSETPDLDLGAVAAGLEAHWQEELNAPPLTEDTPTAVLPKQLVVLEAVGQTDTGRQRHHNEDFYLIDSLQHYSGTAIGQKLQARGLYVLCDGMGGHAQGEVASSLAAHTLFHFFQEHWLEGEPLPPEDVIEQAIFAANQAIFNNNEEQRTMGSGRMGTTLVFALVHNHHVCVAHVGDSRVYRFTRRQGLEQLTTDHEVGQRDIKRGVEPEIAYARPDAYQLTQALGPRNSDYLNPDIMTIEVNDDTLFLLCSDGLTDNRCLESHIESHIAPLLSFDNSLAKGVRTLINVGNEHNGHDNLTLIAIRMKMRSELDQIF